MGSYSHKDNLLRGVSIQTITTIAMGVMEILIFSLMSRLLNRVEFGYYAAISGVITIISSLSEAGLGSAIIQKKDASREYISTAFTLSVIIGLVGMLSVFLFSSNIARIVADETINAPLKVMSITIFLNCVISVFNAILYREYNFKRIGILQVSSYFISSIVGIILAVLGCGLYAIVCHSVLYLFILSLLLFISLKSRPGFNLTSADIAPILSYGGWLTAGACVNNLTSQIDKIFMSKWLSVEALGTYNRPAGFIATITGKINAIFDTALFPVLSDIQDDKAKITNVFYNAISLLNSFSIIVASIFFFNAELIVRIFFGNDWLNIVPLVRIISISVIFNIDSRLVDCFFRSLNYVKTGFYIRILGFFLTLICMYVGSRFDLMGTASGFVFAYTCITIIKMIVLCKKIDANYISMFTIWFKAWKPIVPLFIFGCLFGVIMNNSIMLSLLFAAIYLLLIIVELFFLPQLVGQQYMDNIYPTIKQFKTRILSWIKKK